MQIVGIHEKEPLQKASSTLGTSLSNPQMSITFKEPSATACRGKHSENDTHLKLVSLEILEQ